MFDKQISWTACDSFLTPECDRAQKGKLCGRYVIQIHSLVIQFTAKKMPIRPLRVKQNGRTAGDRMHMLTATQVAGPERLILHAQRCPVILSTSGTFLPLGQSCVYFQGAVFFPGPSWPRAKAFGRDPRCTKGPGIPAVVSNPQCQLVLMLQREIWRRKAAWDIKKPSSEFLWKGN